MTDLKKNGGLFETQSFSNGIQESDWFYNHSWIEHCWKGQYFLIFN